MNFYSELPHMIARFNAKCSSHVDLNALGLVLMNFRIFGLNPAIFSNVYFGCSQRTVILPIKIFSKRDIHLLYAVFKRVTTNLVA